MGCRPRCVIGRWKFQHTLIAPGAGGETPPQYDGCGSRTHKGADDDPCQQAIS